MKEYVKPTFEMIELRAEERLATCLKPASKNANPNAGCGKPWKNHKKANCSL